jgi:hypothetical protein
VTERIPPSSAQTNSAGALSRLAEQSASSYASVSTYMARLRRREQVNGRDKPEEILVFKYRQEPYSVYFKWLGREGQGREVAYVRGRYGDQIHTLLTAGDVPFMPAGKHLAVSPDNVLVRSASRHPITDAGIGHLVDEFGRLVQARSTSLKYLGAVKRPEFDMPLESVQQTIAARVDPQLPRGGTRWWMFDATHHLPLLIVTEDTTGHEVEYYCYDRIQFNLPFDDAEFDPAKLWPEKPSSFAAHSERKQND